MAKKEIPDLRKLRDDYDQARRRLIAGIRKAFEEGHGPSEVARSVDWSREYVAQIRDGKVTD